MHQPVEHTILRITDQTTKAELEEAMANHVATLQRTPAHWTDRRNRLHAQLDAMLDDWERAPDGRAQVPHP